MRSGHLRGKLGDRDAAAAPDEVGDRGHLVARDVDVLAAVVHHAGQVALRFQRAQALYGILRAAGGRGPLRADWGRKGGCASSVM